MQECIPADTDTQAKLPAAHLSGTAATVVSAVMEEEEQVVEGVDSLVQAVEEAVVDLEVRAVFKVRATPLWAFSAMTRHWIDLLGETS